MLQDNLFDLLLHPDYRIQRRHGVLKDHGNLLAPDAVHLPLRLFGQFFPVKADAAADDPAGRIGNQSQNPQRRGGLSRAGLAHQAKCLPLFHPETDAVHRLHHTFAGEVLDNQIPDFKQCSHFSSPHRFSLGSMASRSPSPTRLNRISVTTMAMPGNTNIGQKLRI